MKVPDTFIKEKALVASSLNIVFRKIILTPLLLTSWETFLQRQSHTSSWRSVNSEEWRRAADKPALCSYSTFQHTTCISSPPNISAFNSSKWSQRRGGWAGLGWAGMGLGQESYEKCFLASPLKLKVHLFIQFLGDTKTSWASHYKCARAHSDIQLSGWMLENNKYPGCMRVFDING